MLQNEIPEAKNLAGASTARRLEIRTILNAAPARAFTTDLSSMIDILVVNAIEPEMLGGGGVTSMESALVAARTLAKTFSAVVVTAGGDGVAYADHEGREHLVQPIRITVASTHGADDTFVGTFAGDLAAGTDVRSALEAANIAAAKLVSTPETDR